MRRFLLIIVAVLVSVPLLAIGQPLADRVPDDALLYIGWSGSEQVGPAYEGTHLQGIVRASDLPKFIDDFLPRLAERIGREGREAKEAAALVSALGSAMWRHPSALYVGPVDFANPRKPMPRVAFLCAAGKDGAALLDQANAAIAQVNPNDVPLQASLYGDVLAVTIGRSDRFDALLGGPAGVAPAAPLSAKKEFAAGLMQVQKNALGTVYLDVQGTLKLVDLAVQQENDANVVAMWLKGAEASGLRGVQHFLWTGGFDGKDWAHQMFLAAPMPRKGLVAAVLEPKPLSDDILKAIPADAAYASAGQFDLGRFVTELRALAAEVQPGAEQQIDGFLQQVNQMIGMDVQKDLIDPIGDQWALYTSPSVGGHGFLGTALVNRADDAAKANQSFSQLENLANQLVREQFKRQKITIAMHQTKAGDVALHYLGMPLLAPGWAIDRQNIYFGLHPQVLAAATSHAGTGGKSILDNPKFTAVRDRLKTPNAAAIEFIDLQQTAPGAYPALLTMSRYMGFADLFGVPMPPMVVPPIGAIQAHLAPAGAVSWTDDAGWHARTISPFPGSSLLAIDPASTTMMGQGMLMSSILLPSLNRARETANRAKCANNLRQIGLATIMFANDNKGKFPEDFAAMLLTQDITADVFICPSTSNTLPAHLLNDRQAMARWVNDNASYVYLGKGMNVSAPADVALACEKEHNHDGDGMNMVFADGHVEWFIMPQAQRLLQQQAAPKKGGL